MYPSLCSTRPPWYDVTSYFAAGTGIRILPTPQEPATTFELPAFFPHAITTPSENHDHATPLPALPLVDKRRLPLRRPPLHHFIPEPRGMASQCTSPFLLLFSLSRFANWYHPEPPSLPLSYIDPCIGGMAPHQLITQQSAPRASAQSAASGSPRSSPSR